MPTTCTTTTNENLVREDFEFVWKLISNNFCARAHAIQKYPNLIEFFQSWFDFMKNKSIPLVGPRCKPLI
jgi:hypothetical protein